MSSNDSSFSDVAQSLPVHGLLSQSEMRTTNRSRHKITPSEFVSVFTGFFVVEFDLEDGEVVIYKDLNSQLNDSVEKELVRVLMGCDYSADNAADASDPPVPKTNLILTHSIMNFHCIVRSCLLTRRVSTFRCTTRRTSGGLSRRRASRCCSRGSSRASRPRSSRTSCSSARSACRRSVTATGGFV